MEGGFTTFPILLQSGIGELANEGEDDDGDVEEDSGCG
jgi:hypothetical protein